jgi:hypothetical protein
VKPGSFPARPFEVDQIQLIRSPKMQAVNHYEHGPFRAFWFSGQHISRRLLGNLRVPVVIHRGENKDDGEACRHIYWTEKVGLSSRCHVRISTSRVLFCFRTMLLQNLVAAAVGKADCRSPDHFFRGCLGSCLLSRSMLPGLSLSAEDIMVNTPRCSRSGDAGAFSNTLAM